MLTQGPFNTKYLREGLSARKRVRMGVGTLNLSASKRNGIGSSVSFGTNNRKKGAMNVTWNSKRGLTVSIYGTGVRYTSSQKGKGKTGKTRDQIKKEAAQKKAAAEKNRKIKETERKKKLADREAAAKRAEQAKAQKAADKKAAQFAKAQSGWYSILERAVDHFYSVVTKVEEMVATETAKKFAKFENLTNFDSKAKIQKGLTEVEGLEAVMVKKVEAQVKSKDFKVPAYAQLPGAEKDAYRELITSDKNFTGVMEHSLTKINFNLKPRTKSLQKIVDELFGEEAANAEAALYTAYLASEIDEINELIEKNQDISEKIKKLNGMMLGTIKPSLKFKYLDLEGYEPPVELMNDVNTLLAIGGDDVVEETLKSIEDVLSDDKVTDDEFEFVMKQFSIINDMAKAMDKEDAKNISEVISEQRLVIYAKYVENRINGLKITEKKLNERSLYLNLSYLIDDLANGAKMVAKSTFKNLPIPAKIVKEINNMRQEIDEYFVNFVNAVLDQTEQLNNGEFSNVEIVTIIEIHEKGLSNIKPKLKKFGVDMNSIEGLIEQEFPEIKAKAIEDSKKEILELGKTKVKNREETTYDEVKSILAKNKQSIDIVKKYLKKEYIDYKKEIEQIKNKRAGGFGVAVSNFFGGDINKLAQNIKNFIVKQTKDGFMSKSTAPDFLKVHGPAFIDALEAWAKLNKDEYNSLEDSKKKSLNKIFEETLLDDEQTIAESYAEDISRFIK